jgi:hypothetical protein
MMSTGRHSPWSRLRTAMVALPLVAVLLATVFVGAAAAAPNFRIAVSPRRIAIGGRVTITTSPRERCMLTVDIARRKFSHLMPYGWIQVTMPRNFHAGRVGLVVSCAGKRAGGSFIVR